MYEPIGCSDQPSANYQDFTVLLNSQRKAPIIQKTDKYNIKIIHVLFHMNTFSSYFLLETQFFLKTTLGDTRAET